VTPGDAWPMGASRGRLVAADFVCSASVAPGRHFAKPEERFARFPLGDIANLTDCKIAIFGAAEGSPYTSEKQSHSAKGPSAMREASQRFAGQLQQFDFDIENVLIGPDRPQTVILDCGDVYTDPQDGEGNRRRIADATSAVLSAGAVPIILGGDDSIPIPWFAGFEGRGPFTVLQIDAHTDWGDVIQGNPFGYGSTMRRAAELPWIQSMVQVGARGLGSGAEWQIEDARKWGSRIVTMKDIRRNGIQQAISEVSGGEVLVSIDCDGLDPSVLAAVNMPTPGGLTYSDVVELLTGVTHRAKIAGLAMVELVPERDDHNKFSALTAARIVGVALGLIARS
jgi:agmatinase